MVALQIQRGFPEEMEVFVQTAQALGELRRDGNKAGFKQVLEAVGMSLAEADSFFDLVISRSGHNLAWDDSRVKSNTTIADAFGISLENSENHPPRNWLLYRLFALHFPGMFQASYSGVTHLRSSEVKKDVPSGCKVNPMHRLVHFSNLPLESNGQSGNPIALYRVIKGHEPAKFRAEVMRIANPLRAALGEDIGMALADLLFALQMLIPSKPMAQALARVVQAGQAGEEVVFAGAFCPDYAFEETGNPHIPYRYTFDGVGEGVGLVAQQFARIIPELSYFFQKLGIAHRFVIGIGDFEADSESVLSRVGLSRTEFIRRCQCSLDAFQELMPEDVPIELELFDAKRGNGMFREYALRCTEKMVSGDFGMMRTLHPDLDEVIARIPGQYRTFYERWYGTQMDDATVRKIVYSQGGEYAAVAGIYRRDFGDNTIFLSGDRPEMNRFNAFDAPLPVLCAKRAY